MIGQPFCGQGVLKTLDSGEDCGNSPHRVPRTTSKSNGRGGYEHWPLPTLQVFSTALGSGCVEMQEPQNPGPLLSLELQAYRHCSQPACEQHRPGAQTQLPLTHTDVDRHHSLEDRHQRVRAAARGHVAPTHLLLNLMLLGPCRQGPEAPAQSVRILRGQVWGIFPLWGEAQD